MSGHPETNHIEVRHKGRNLLFTVIMLEHSLDEIVALQWANYAPHRGTGMQFILRNVKLIIGFLCQQQQTNEDIQQRQSLMINNMKAIGECRWLMGMGVRKLKQHFLAVLMWFACNCTAR